MCQCLKPLPSATQIVPNRMDRLVGSRWIAALPWSLPVITCHNIAGAVWGRACRRRQITGRLPCAAELVPFWVGTQAATGTG